jgi:hypothetical protein
MYYKKVLMHCLILCVISFLLLGCCSDIKKYLSDRNYFWIPETLKIENVGAYLYNITMKSQSGYELKVHYSVGPGDTCLIYPILCPKLRIVNAEEWIPSTISIEGTGQNKYNVSMKNAAGFEMTVHYRTGPGDTCKCCPLVCPSLYIDRGVH